MNVERVKVIGIGGIGGCLLPVLLRFLNYRGGLVSVALIDGDRFEDRNAIRQRFDRPGNKATVAVAMYRSEFRSLTFEVVHEYVTTQNIAELIVDGDIVFLCVDNHATRKLVSDHAERLRNVLVISGGNELTDGNAQIFWRENGKNKTLPLANRFHREIVEPADANPGEVNCTARAASGEPQLLLANNAAATCMLNAFYAWLEGCLAYDEVYFDIRTGSVRTEKRPR